MGVRVELGRVLREVEDVSSDVVSPAEAGAVEAFSVVEAKVILFPPATSSPSVVVVVALSELMTAGVVASTSFWLVSIGFSVEVGSEVADCFVVGLVV